MSYEDEHQKRRSESQKREDERRELKKEYTRRLKAWVAMVDEKQYQLAELTGLFAIDPDKAEHPPISDATVSRVINIIPAGNSQKVYNLICLLAVFHMLEVITLTEIKSFLDQFEVKIPEGDTWTQIYERIQLGIGNRHSQPSLDEEINPTPSTELPIDSDSKPSNSKNSTKKLLLTFISIYLVLLVVVLLSWRRSSPQSDTNPIYSGPTSPANSIFLPDQGFSLYSFNSESPQSGILSANVRSVGLNESGVWIGYSSQQEELGAVSYYNKKSWFHCLDLPILINQTINDFAFVNSTTYIATDGAGIIQINQSSWRQYTTEDGLPSNSVYSLYIDNNNRLWATTYEGVAWASGDRWETAYQATPDGLVSSHIHTTLQDTNGNLWFGSINKGISQLTPNQEWHSYYTSEVGLQNIRGSMLDNDGGVWFASDGGGVLRFHNNIWGVFTIQNGLPSNNVYDIEEDQLGRVWVATNEGLAYTKDFGQTWETHSTMSVFDIEFGCNNCPYSEIHMWLALKDGGVAHVRIPPLTPTIEYISTPSPITLSPGQEYVFEVEVLVLSESLTNTEGDSLRSMESDPSLLYGAYPIIPVTGEINLGQKYTFSNINDPIIAPNTPGTYQTFWRVWQGMRFVTQPIVIEFTVTNE
jgi:streptogramin lyase